MVPPAPLLSQKWAQDQVANQRPPVPCSNDCICDRHMAQDKTIILDIFLLGDQQIQCCKEETIVIKEVRRAEQKRGEEKVKKKTAMTRESKRPDNLFESLAPVQHEAISVMWTILIFKSGVNCIFLN